jgi:Family of unknown function (DUF6088)
MTTHGKFVRNRDIRLTDMATLAAAVINYVGQVPEGVPVAAKELLHLGARAAVDCNLSRLVRAGRGLYVRPVAGRFGVRPPESTKVVQALAEQRGERIVPHGAAAANELGLTTQVPVREVYLTSGPTRKLKLGQQVIELRHAPAWQLVLPGRPAGAAIRALACGCGRSKPVASSKCFARNFRILKERPSRMSAGYCRPGWRSR